MRGGFEKTQLQPALQVVYLLIKFENNFRCVCLLSHSGSGVKTVVLKPGCLEEPPGNPWKNAVARATPLVILESLAWDGAQPSLFSPGDSHVKWRTTADLLGSPPAPGLSHTLPRSQYCAFFHHFPICCFLYLLCTSLIPDSWDSRTAWPMKKNTVKHGQQEVTPYLTSVLLTCNLQEGCVLRTIL